MRMLHTSDWHLGRRFGQVSLADDHAAFVDWLIAAARSEAVDLVVIAGDVFDRAVPPVEAVALFRQALVDLVAIGCRVVVIAGNHDSAERLAAADGLTDAAGVYLRGGADRAGSTITIEFADGPLDIVAVPYLDPVLAPADFVADIETAGRRPSHQSIINAALARAERHSPRRIAIAHAFVAGATETDSERALTVGTSPRVAVSTFAGFDYVALGHLHRPQTAGSDIVRYSGSPLPFSFSEGHTKQVTLVDLDASGGAAVTPIDIPLGRPVATLRGTIDDLLLSSAHDHVEQHFVRAVLTDRGYVLDAKARLQERFAYVTEVQLEAAGSVARPPSAEPVAARSPLDVTAEFWHDVTNEPLDGPTRSLLAELLTTASVAGDDRQQAVKASGAPAQDAVHAASVAGERAR